MLPEIITRNALPSDLALETVKSYLRVYDDEHDATITLLISAAVEFVQTYTRQTFRSTQYRHKFTTEPFVMPRFPVISIDLMEETVDDAWVELSSGDLAEYELDDSTPPELEGDSLALPVRITWTAGWSDWPKDLVLIIWQMVAENFDQRRATPGSAQSVAFSNAFKLALEQYCTHHDAVI